MAIDYAAARYCAQLAARLYRGREIPERLRRHFDWLMSEVGPESQAHQRELTYEPIGVTTAADILGCTDRHVRRIAADLDGTRIDGGVWVFDRATVVAYAQAKRDRHCA